jgi:hypothetical protein
MNTTLVYFQDNYIFALYLLSAAIFIGSLFIANAIVKGCTILRDRDKR